MPLPMPRTTDARCRWTDAHEQEAQRQRALRRTRACEAVQTGAATMDRASVTAQDMAAYTQKERKRQHELEVKWKRDAKVVQPKAKRKLRDLSDNYSNDDHHRGGSGT